jgi:Fic family protein
VRAAVPATDFTIAEIEAASGASTATVRKVITGMIDEGVVVDLGPAQDHQGRGRAPMKYRKR